MFFQGIFERRKIELRSKSCMRVGEDDLGFDRLEIFADADF